MSILNFSFNPSLSFKFKKPPIFSSTTSRSSFLTRLDLHRNYRYHHVLNRHLPTLSSAPSLNTATTSNMSSTASSPDTRTVLSERVIAAMSAAYGPEHAADPKLTPATRLDFGDYQCNAAMSLSKKLKSNPRDVATTILSHLEVSDLCSTPQIAGPGFINLTLIDSFVNTKLNSMLSDRQRLGVPKRQPAQRIVVDFSSPNIAKDMHVGHLRSTIIGDTLARILEFLGHDTLRLNHTGDWGTQFGQLITYMKAEVPELLERNDDDDNHMNNLAAAKIGDLVEFYRKSKKCFDEDKSFKARALDEVVELQSGNEDTLRAWKLICNLSRIEFQQIYDRLNVKLTERGESFYNPYLEDTVSDLKSRGFAQKNEGAIVIFLQGDKFKGRDGEPLPVIIQKSNGGYLYATTDLAAVKYRSNEDGAQRIIYVTDVGQTLHFQQIFEVARKTEICSPDVDLVHVPFGLVQGTDGKKFKTRAGAAPKLSELLDEARDRVRAELDKRQEEEETRAVDEGKTEMPARRSEEELQHMSEVIGIAAVKYADLKNNRTSNYKFSFDKMVKLEGDTAPYIMYAYARVQGIYRTASEAAGDLIVDGEIVQFIFEKKEERALAKMLLRLPEVLIELERELLPHVLCDYVKNLTSKFNQFYEQCPVVHAPSEELKASRFGLCQLSADTLQLCLGLLGIPTLEQI